MQKKRIHRSVVEDVKDGRKIKKLHTDNEMSSQSYAALEDSLPEEYQPQFLNYMLIGDLVAIMTVHGKLLINKTKSPKMILYENFCHSAWSVGDVLNELKSKKNCYPIAKNVLLAVGYNDYCYQSLSAVYLIDGIEKIILKLRKRGCEDIILTNIPPAAAKSSSIVHWQYLHTVNTEIMRLCEKYDVGHCDIFKLFGTPKNYFKKTKDYVTFREINYKVDPQLYNESRRDMMSFSDLGKTVLGKHLARSIENRLKFLRQRQVDRVIGSIEVSDEEVEVTAVQKRDPSPPKEVIELLDSDEDHKQNMKIESTVKTEKTQDNVSTENDKANVGHGIDCTCPDCIADLKEFKKELQI